MTASAPTVLVNENKAQYKQYSQELKIDTLEIGEKEQEVIQGIIATTHTDKKNDQYTEQALTGMVQQINEQESEVLTKFPDPERLLAGNLDHQNNPTVEKQGLGDTDIINSAQVKDAELVDLPDGEVGVMATAVLNSNLPEETLELVRGNIRDGFINAFSVEFVAEEIRFERQPQGLVRIIEQANLTGLALTGRPMNPNTGITNAELKSLIQSTNITNEQVFKSSEELKNILEDDTMSEKQKQQAESGEGEPQETKTDNGVKQLREELSGVTEEIQEVKSKMQDLEQEKQSLAEENQELKNQIEDVNELEEVKSGIQEIKNELGDLPLEKGDNTPRTEQGEQKREADKIQEQGEKTVWQRTIDAKNQPEQFLNSQIGSTGKTNLDVMTEQYNVSEQEVKSYVNEN